MEDITNLENIPLIEIYNAQKYSMSNILNTPLVKLNLDIPGKNIYLKLENFQPTGSFKIRGVVNSILNIDKDKLQRFGIYTSSSGNFGTALSWAAKTLNVQCKVIVPDNIDATKLKNIKSYGGQVTQVPYNEWWDVMLTSQCNGFTGSFIHPTANRHCVAGYGVIGLEIIDQLPDVSTIIVPYGGGGNSIGIASTIKQLTSDVKVYACEVETAAPLRDSFQAGHPVTVQDYQPSFVGGINGPSMFSCAWNLAKKNLDGSIVTSLREICDAITLLYTKNEIVAEGAGAASVAAAIKDESLRGNIVCVISGGNINWKKLSTVMNGDVPE